MKNVKMRIFIFIYKKLVNVYYIYRVRKWLMVSVTRSSLTPILLHSYLSD